MPPEAKVFSLKHRSKSAAKNKLRWLKRAPIADVPAVTFVMFLLLGAGWLILAGKHNRI